MKNQQPLGFSVQLQIRLDGRRIRRWHVDLLGLLSKVPGVGVTVNAAPGYGSLPRSGERLVLFDAICSGIGQTVSLAAAPADLAAYQVSSGRSIDITLDLCGDVDPRAGRVWRLTYAASAAAGEHDIVGAYGEVALLELLLGGHAPVAAISEEGRVVAAGRLGTEHRGTVMLAFEDYLTRTATLIVATLRGSARTPPMLCDPPLPSVGQPLGNRNLGVAAARQMVRSVLRHGFHLCYLSPHWRVGWRRLDGPDVMESRRHPRDGWQNLPDDGQRFYADPFPLEFGGEVTLFLEEFVHRSGRGVISAVKFGPEGPVGRPTPVLERPYHLSYPFVFARDGEVWMIPESCAAGTIDLFRATDFPGGWVKEATLVAEVVASDATIVEHGGKWWMFATVRDHGGAFSDTLHLWSAPDFRGPWAPHHGNPIMIDISAARPAGRIVSRGSVLLRPVQDCRRGYGAALGIARIQQLDDDGYAQVVEATLTAGPEWPGSRLHTLNCAGGFEFIDGSAKAPSRLGSRISQWINTTS